MSLDASVPTHRNSWGLVGGPSASPRRLGRATHRVHTDQVNAQLVYSLLRLSSAWYELEGYARGAVRALDWHCNHRKVGCRPSNAMRRAKSSRRVGHCPHHTTRVDPGDRGSARGPQGRASSLRRSDQLPVEVRHCRDELVRLTGNLGGGEYGRKVCGAPLPGDLPVDISSFLHNPGVFGVGDPTPWYKVTDPLYPPNNAIGFVKRGPALATGFQISERHVVTAAHALGFPDEQPLPPKTEVYYAPPAGGPDIRACKWHIPPQYTAFADQGDEWKKWDFAVLTLEHPVPSAFWFGLFAGSDALWEGGGSFVYLRGFPTGTCAPPGAGGKLWGNGISATRWPGQGFDRFFPVKAPAAPRMSGGPAFIVSGGSAFAMGVIQNDSGPQFDCAAWVTRFDNEAIDAILQGRFSC